MMRLSRFTKTARCFGGAGNDTYSLTAGFGANVIEDNDGDNTIKFLDITSEAVLFEMTDGGALTVTIAESGDVLTIRGFDSERFAFEFADGVSGFYDTEIGGLKSTGNNSDDSEDENPTDESGDSSDGDSSVSGEQTGDDSSGDGSGQNTPDENDSSEKQPDISGNDETPSSDVSDSTIIFGESDSVISAENGIEKIKFNGRLPEDLTVYFTADGSAVLTAVETGETLTIENFSGFAESGVVLDFDGVEMRLDDDNSPFLNVVGTDSDDDITAFYKNSSMFGGAGNDMYSLAAGFGENVIEDNDGDNTIRFLDINSDGVVFEMDGSMLTVTVSDSGDVLTIRNFDSERFVFEFADGVSGSYDIIQNGADLLDELYSDDDPMSGLLTDDDMVIPEIADSASAVDENDDSENNIDIQVMILAENMAAFTNENAISDSINLQSRRDSLAFADQPLIGTKAS